MRRVLNWTIIDTRTGRRAAIGRYVSKPQALGVIHRWHNRDQAEFLEPVRAYELERR